MQTTLQSPMPKKRIALFDIGFRPFFLVASLFSIIVTAIWMTTFTLGNTFPTFYVTPIAWHGHEMVFGYTTAIIAGFLLTAVFLPFLGVIAMVLFKGDYKAKKFDDAYENWLWCMDNCPTLSVNIYKYGIKIAEHRLKNATGSEIAAAKELVMRVYMQRLEHKFKKDKKAVIYNYIATFKAKQGESEEEVIQTMKDLRNVGLDVITIGQYLQPSKKHLPVIEFITPQQFDKYKEIGMKMGFKYVESGALVRSSYKAQRHLV